MSTGQLEEVFIFRYHINVITRIRPTAIMVLLDTATLVFWTLDPERLTQTAANAIEKADRVCFSSISIWVIGVKVKREKLVLPLTVGEFVEKLDRTDRVELLPVDVRTWIDSLELAWNHRDPADRTIVATAGLHACPLVTPNTVIRNFYSQAVW